MMDVCNKCSKVVAALLGLLGLAFLAVDLGLWNFWHVNWWTVFFLLSALCAWGKSSCPTCIPSKKK